METLKAPAKHRITFAPDANGASATVQTELSTSPRTPYVFSADVGGIVTRWGREAGYSVPNHDYFNGVTRDLHSLLGDIFPEGVDVVEEGEIRKGIRQRASLVGLPVISLDRTYIDRRTPNVRGFLDMTRAVDENFKSRGYVPRPGADSYEEQLQRVRDEVRGPVILADDVLFTGGTLLDKARDLARMGSPVKGLIVGIAIQNGIAALEKEGIAVLPVRTYEDGVIDEICQRDTIAGLGGTTMITDEGEYVSSPYMQPFGDPIGRASIPRDKAVQFSEFCLETSIDLWRRVEKASQAAVPTNAVPRPVRIPRQSSMAVALSDIRAELALHN